MADPEHLRILKQGVNAFNDWRNENPDIQPNLIKADLSKVQLRGANLRGANLEGANLYEVDLRETNLIRADLSKAHLKGANLCEVKLWEASLTDADLGEAKLSRANISRAGLNRANLSRANLSRANLKEAQLQAADLSEAGLGEANLSRAHLGWVTFSEGNVKKANFSLAQIGYTTFGNIDLSNVSGLESTKHFGPSTIGIDTIFRSRGKIPHKFLEDAGVPDIFNEYMGSLTGQAFQYYSCFISHSTNDKDFADRIYADLRKEGVRCWFAPEDMKSGKKIYHQLDEAIKIYDKLLLILSEGSINSDWVANEIRWARKREKQEGRQKLFPVSVIDFEKLKGWELFDADTATDLAAEVRSYFIPNFTNWKDHESYQQAFQRLLRDLQATER